MSQTDARVAKVATLAGRAARAGHEHQPRYKAQHNDQRSGAGRAGGELRARRLNTAQIW